MAKTLKTDVHAPCKHDPYLYVQYEMENLDTSSPSFTIVKRFASKYDNVMSQSELFEILHGSTYDVEFGRKVNTILHERDYFTSANPLPPKGNAVTIANGMTVQDLTKAIILDKDADAGTSHFEAIRSRYGVSPRSLGNIRPVSAAQTTRQVISINPIFNQSEDTVAPTSVGTQGVNFQGEISGRVSSSDGSHYVSFDADVDGVLMTLVFIRPQTIYHQGLDRKFSRLARNDFFEPAMINDGDEPIYNKELVYPIMQQPPPRRYAHPRTLHV